MSGSEFRIVIGARAVLMTRYFVVVVVVVGAVSWNREMPEEERRRGKQDARFSEFRDGDAAAHVVSALGGLGVSWSLPPPSLQIFPLQSYLQEEYATRRKIERHIHSVREACQT